MKLSKHQFNNCILYFAVFILIVFGVYFIFQSFPYINNNLHKNIRLTRIYETNNPRGYFSITYTTRDVFVAGNPINISIVTENMKDFEHLELQFIGSEKYFLEYYNYTNTTISNLIDIQQKLQNLSEKILRTHVALKKKNYAEDYDYFEGSINDVIYTSSGDFDIGVTVRKDGEFFKGYLVGDKEYIIEDAIHISPHENMISLKTNQIMVGLSWLGIGIALLIAGLNGFLGILNNNRKSYREVGGEARRSGWHQK